MMLAWIFGLALSVWTASAASSDCLNVKFYNWDNICLGINKNWSKNFEISVDKNNLEKNSTVRCYVILPNSTMYSLNWCKGTFSYAWAWSQDVIVSATYVTKNDNFYSKRIPTVINFNNGSWASSSNTSSSSSSSSSNNSDEVKLSTNRTSPSTSQYVNLTIKTDKKYTGKLTLSAKYRSSSSSSWSSISNTSSTYFTNYSDEWDDGYYKMTSSDKGEITLSNLLKFKKNGYYRIYVKDTDGNESYIQFNVWVSSSSNSSNEDLKVSASPSNPDTYEWVKLTIETDDDYTGRINFSKFQYKSSSSSSWSSISRTSSTYVSDYSNEWNNGYYKMTSSDKGETTLKNFIQFKKSGYYRIYIEDTDGNESYVQVNVDTSSSSSSSYNGNIELSTNRKSPSTNQYVNLTIETDDDYVGNLSFYTKYRSSSSSSWTTISKTSRTSSTYFSDYSDEWADGYYKMRSSDNGEITLKDLVKFRKSGYYRIYVEDTDGNESYIEFNVDTSSSSSSSSSNDEIELSTNKESPSTNQYVNLTIETDRKYTGKLTLSAKYRSSSSSSWSSISNISSTYFSDYSDEWDDGYYKMKSSDDGEITLKNLIKFKKNGYYRIYVEDTDGNESYIQFNVWDVDDDSNESSISGFSKSQLTKLKNVYKEWDDMMWEMKRRYPSLKKDNYWIKISDNFYNDMGDVINNKRYRNFSDYSDFQDAFDDWYKYTMRNI